MGDKEFWDLIAWANAQEEHPDDREDVLGDALGDLPPGEMEDFYLIYDRHVTAAWTADVALLAYLVNRYGDRSAYDDLLEFICWLIDRGRVVYQAALTDPDRLADVAEDLPWGSEGYWHVVSFEWASATGQTEGAFFARVGERGAGDLQEYPGGGTVEPDDLRRRWPRLCKRFVDERRYPDEA
jgi:hypothetical protein